MKFRIGNSETEIEFTSDLKHALHSQPECVFIIDAKILDLYQDLLNDVDRRVFRFEARERHKSLAAMQKIYEFLAENYVKRSSFIVGIGGGITTDLAAFAASTFKRGCRLILVPTTLLGMVDAAVGGKTGLNFNGIKNGIGSFYPAEKVMINTDFLKTLPDKEIQEGMVEIVKMSFLPKSNLAGLLAKKERIETIIEEAVRTKMDLCRNDPADKAARRFLNLGHTFGHVLETVSDYAIPHGTAVAVGIRAAAELSFRRNNISPDSYQNILKRLDDYDLPATYPQKYLPQLKNMGESTIWQDKKADKKINLILFGNEAKLIVQQTNDSREIIEILGGFADET